MWSIHRSASSITAPPRIVGDGLTAKIALSLIAAAACLFEVSPASAQSATFTGLGFLPGHVYSSAQGVSADGNVVVGGSSANPNGNPNGGEAVRWVNAGPPGGLGFLPDRNGSGAYAANANGSVIVGYSFVIGDHGEQGFRWVQDASPGGGTMSALPIPAPQNCAAAYGVSGDGALVAGTANICYSGSPYQAFLWTNGVSTGLGHIQGYPDSSQARGMSSDGAFVVGYAEINDAACDAEAFRWANGSFQLLGIPRGFTRSLGRAVNSDGSGLGRGVPPGCMPAGRPAGFELCREVQFQPGATRRPHLLWAIRPFRPCRTPSSNSAGLNLLTYESRTGGAHPAAQCAESGGDMRTASCCRTRRRGAAV